MKQTRKNNIMPRRIKIKNDFGDEMENVFEKTRFSCVSTFVSNTFLKKDHFCVSEHFFFENFFKKRLFLRVTTYFVEKVFEKRPFFRM